MTQLIPFQNRQIADASIPTVDARDLHAFLEIGKDYTSWIKAQVKRAHLIENRDFVLFTQNGVKGNKPTSEYFLTFDAGKHVAMMSGSPKGFEVREYFIACEAALLAQPETEGSLLVRMAQAYERQERAILALRAEQDHQKDILLATQEKTIHAFGLALTAIHGQQWLTIRQYVAIHKLERQLPLEDQRRYARVLGDYCFANGCPMYKALTVDVLWPEEKTYFVGAIDTTLPPWLAQRNGQVGFMVQGDQA
jgi:phage anti-repressor protein